VLAEEPAREKLTCEFSYSESWSYGNVYPHATFFSEKFFPLYIRNLYRTLSRRDPYLSENRVRSCGALYWNRNSIRVLVLYYITSSLGNCIPLLTIDTSLLSGTKYLSTIFNTLLWSRSFLQVYTSIEL
jgi:hypothetical protein